MMRNTTEKKHLAAKENKKLPAIDRGLFWLVNNYLVEIVLIVAVAGAVLIRWILSNRIVRDPSDYNNFLLPWCLQYRSLGIHDGLAQNFSDYYVPYNLVLAIISQFFENPARPIGIFNSVFDFVTAIFVYKIGCWYLSNASSKEDRGQAKKPDKSIRRRSALIAVATLYLPFTFLNSAYWKQCDGVYSCFLIISLYYFLREKYTASLIGFSFAFCFKLQAIFFLPFLLIGYIARQRFSIIKFLWVPVLYFLAGLPAVLCGRGFQDTYGTYFAQAQEHTDTMALNTANFYALGITHGEAMMIPAIVIMVAVILFMAAAVCQKRNRMGEDKWMLLASWMMLTCYMFLPKMHERYDYCGILLLCIFALLTSRLIPSAVILVICELLVYNVNIFDGNAFPNSVIAIVYCANYFYVTYQLLADLNGKIRQIQKLV